MHGLVPPHPGPLTAIGLLHADLGVTLALGVAVAIPTVIVAGPLLAASPAVGWFSTCRIGSRPTISPGTALVR